ncbi:MAG: hypothetical protein ACRDGV_06855 [Candidatus Limnocylindria bacterium]
MTQLKYLVDEICSGVEVYFTGRSGGQYLRTAYILCDDYTELTSKLFLLADDRNWRDAVATRNGERFKNYAEVQADVQGAIDAKRPEVSTEVASLLAEMRIRRTRRNDFFHTTSLLDLSVTSRNCVEAFCDLMDYGALLFAAPWQAAVEASRNLESMWYLLQLERLAFSDPAIQPAVNRIMRTWPRNVARPARTGSHVAEFPEDLHLRLCITNGGIELRDRLRDLYLTSATRASALA